MTGSEIQHRKPAHSEQKRYHPVLRPLRPVHPLLLEQLAQHLVLLVRPIDSTREADRDQQSNADAEHLALQRMRRELPPPRPWAGDAEQQTRRLRHQRAVPWVSHERVRPVRDKTVVLLDRELKGELATKPPEALPPQVGTRAEQESPKDGGRCGV